MISTQDKFKAYGIGFVSVFFTGLFGTLLMKDNIGSEWSSKSDIIPPSYAFPMVWTLIYILLAIIIGKTILFKKYFLLILLIISLILHISWSYLYFYKKDPKSASINIAIIFFIGMIMSGVTKDITSAQFLTPYMVWITYLSVINYDSMDK